MVNARLACAAFVALSAAASHPSFAADAGAGEGPVTVSVWRGESTFVPVSGATADALVKWESERQESDVLRRLSAGIDLWSAEPVGGRPDRLVPWTPGGEPPTHILAWAKADARPGETSFGPVKLRVVNRVLPPPSEWKYYLDLWQHPWAVARVAGVEPFSPGHYEAMERVWRQLARCGVKALTTTLVDLPWNHQCHDGYGSMIGRVRNDDGTWVFDYSLFDEYVEFGRRCGIGPDIACYTMCPWGYVVRWRDERGAEQKAEAKPGSPAFDDFWGDFLVDFAAHLKAKGWFDDAYIAMDERSPEDVRFIADFVRAKAPGLKIAMAGDRKPTAFKGITIDNYSQGLAHLTADFLDELPKRRAAGLKTTFYVCCNPARPNTFMSSADDESFWIGAYPAISGFDGFLRWAANSWPADPEKDASFGNWPAGDTFLVYPGGVESARLAALRAGVVAAEKCRILREEGRDMEELDALAAEYGFERAMKGLFDPASFRRALDAFVNR